MPGLKKILSRYGTNPQTWEIYRGDAFQLEIKEPANALWIAIHLKARLKSSGLDVRISIGIGKKEYTGKKITESNGSAFVNSGRKFDMLKNEKVNLAVLSGNEAFDNQMNLFFRFALTIMDNWTPTTAKLVTLLIEQPGKNQLEIAKALKINQSAVSQQKKRSDFDLIQDLNNYFTAHVKETFK